MAANFTFLPLYAYRLKNLDNLSADRYRDRAVSNTGGKLISAASGRIRPEVTIRLPDPGFLFAFWTYILYMSNNLKVIHDVRLVYRPNSGNQILAPRGITPEITSTFASATLVS